MVSKVAPRATGAATGAGVPETRGSRRLDGKSWFWIWTAAILALVILHAIHPRADFPNNSSWLDDAKYTDEGWYGKAAVEHYVRGSWYVPGDFNPAVFVPVLPALELAVFHFTGPGIAAARMLLFAFFAANLLLVYFIVRAQAQRWAALLAVTLLAGNAYLYAFSRLAILESLLIFFLLVSWLLALHLPPPGVSRYTALIAFGVATCLMVWSKTTAVFLLPSTFFLLWMESGPSLSERLKALTTASLAAILPWCAYYFFWVRPRYLADFWYFFIANSYGHPATASTFAIDLWYTLHGILWISPALTLLCLASLFMSAVLFRSLWRNPLFIASLLAIAGYIVFITWHHNLQRRYYQPIAYPMMIVIALSAERLISGLRNVKTKRPVWLAQIAAAAALAITLTLYAAANIRLIVTWTLHPEYTWLDAANGVTQYIDQHPNGNRLLLSVSGDEITLLTGLPGLTDEVGTWKLTARTAHYRPGWFATWNQVDPPAAAALSTQYTLEQVATFNAFDDPDRNQLILYKLHPLKPEK